MIVCFWVFSQKYLRLLPVGESVQKEKVTRSCFCFVFKAGKDFFEFLLQNRRLFLFYWHDYFVVFQTPANLVFFLGKWTVAKPSGMVLCCLYKTLWKKETKRLTSETRQWFFFSNKKKVEYEKSAPNNLQKLGVRAYCEGQTWWGDQEASTCNHTWKCQKKMSHRFLRWTTNFLFKICNTTFWKK